MLPCLTPTPLNPNPPTRIAPFVGSSQITALPPYLTVQMVRFYYKADVQQKAKILRKVRDSLGRRW